MKTSAGAIKYEIPDHWMKYNQAAILEALSDAKAAVMALRSMPYQRNWVEHLQEIELKREIAGTSRIEGADFSEREFEEAFSGAPEQLQTRSQRQAHAAVQTYRWIARDTDGLALDDHLIREIHRRIVTGADDDHCEPGALRRVDQNVVFGFPRHRGAEGGRECLEAFTRFTEALRGEFPGHEPILQAIAAHYHFAAMHPFLDGNGRTARALEALMLQRAGLRDICFVAMSNYYYDEKPAYLSALAAVRRENHDLTDFFLFALKGVASQAGRVLREIQTEVAKAVFRNMMYDLFNRLKTPRKRVIAERQIEILKILLESNKVGLQEIARRTDRFYTSLRDPHKGLIRDLNGLLRLRAIEYEKTGEDQYFFSARLEWPKEISETDFLKRIKSLPKAKTHSFLG
jgi:Fic family protein